MFGTRFVASLAHDPNANVHTDGKQIIHSHELTTELGAKKGKKYGPMGFGINAIVQRAGFHPVLLNFPGMPMPVKRETQIQPRWMEEPAVARRDPLVPKPEPKEEEETGSGAGIKQMKVSLSKEDIAREFDL